MFGQQQKRQYLPAVTWADNGRLSHHRCHHLHLATCSIHTQKVTLNDTTLLRNTRKVLFSANFSASLFWEAKQREAPSAGVEVPSDGEDHVVSTASWGTGAGDVRETCGLIQEVMKTFFLCSDCAGLWSLPSCAPSVLLVMLIVSRPPAECDPLPAGGLWSRLPEQMMSVCASGCVYNVSQKLLWCFTRVLVCDYVCRGALAQIFMRQPQLGTLYSQSSRRSQGGRKTRQCFISVLIILLLIRSIFDPISKAKPVGERKTFSFLFPQWITSDGFVGNRMAAASDWRNSSRSKVPSFVTLSKAFWILRFNLMYASVFSCEAFLLSATISSCSDISDRWHWTRVIKTPLTYSLNFLHREELLHHSAASKSLPNTSDETMFCLQHRNQAHFCLYQMRWKWKSLAVVFLLVFELWLLRAKKQSVPVRWKRCISSEQRCFKPLNHWTMFQCQKGF